jgi:DNA-binding transcriptional regulator YiaG
MSGVEFRKLRESITITQRELGALLEVSERGIRRWENGEVDVPKLAVFALLYLVEKQRKRVKR